MPKQDSSKSQADKFTQVSWQTWMGVIKFSKQTATATDSVIGSPCFFCGEPIEVGQEAVNVPMRPASLMDIERRHRGLSYNIICDIAHWTCTVKSSIEGGGHNHG